MAASGVEVLTDTKVERLIVAGDGRVAGVSARRYGEDLAVRARRGVVLAGGGFVSNEEMLRRYAPALVGHGKVGADSDDGRAIRMALAVGAEVQHMEAGEAAINFPPTLMPQGVIVNGTGQRFINEDTYPGASARPPSFTRAPTSFSSAMSPRSRPFPRANGWGALRRGYARPSPPWKARWSYPRARCKAPWSCTTGMRRGASTRSSTRTGDGFARSDLRWGRSRWADRRWPRPMDRI